MRRSGGLWLLVVAFGALGVFAAGMGASTDPHIVQWASHVYRMVLMILVTLSAAITIER